MEEIRIVRITTTPGSLRTLLKGQLSFLLQQGCDIIGVSSAGEALDDVRKKEGIRTYSIEMTRSISPLKDLMAIWRFYRFCKKEKPDIIHSHTPKAGLIGMLGGRIAGVKIRLHTLAGMPMMETSGFKRIILSQVEKLTYFCATKVYPISYGLEKFILDSKFIRKDKTKVLANGSSNGIDSDYFDPQLISYKEKIKYNDDLGITKQDFVFIFIGRLVREKGIKELIDAFLKVKKEKSVKLIILGNSDNTQTSIKNTINEISNNPQIKYMGFQKDIRPYLAIADCLVFPSYREGFGNVTVQAGLMEKPVIVTDIIGSNEIVCNGDNGIIVPPKNSNELYKAMIKIIEDEQLRNKFISNSRKMVKDKYDQKIVWNSILEEYKYFTNKIN